MITPILRGILGATRVQMDERWRVDRVTAGLIRAVPRLAFQEKSISTQCGARTHPSHAFGCWWWCWWWCCCWLPRLPRLPRLLPCAKFLRADTTTEEVVALGQRITHLTKACTIQNVLGLMEESGTEAIEQAVQAGCLSWLEQLTHQLADTEMLKRVRNDVTVS